MRTPDPPGARRVIRLKVNSLASPTTTFGSKSVDLTQIPGVTRGNVIQTRLDPPRKEPEMTNQDPASIAANLTYMQRKTLRRLSRGQSVSRTQQNDPLIRTLTTTDHYPQLPANYDICDWTDWAHAINRSTPRLTKLGQQTLTALEGDQA